MEAAAWSFNSGFVRSALREMARDRADTETWVTTLKQQLELANSREPAESL